MPRQQRAKRPRSLVGRDFSTLDRRRASRLIAPTLVGLLIAAIGLVALRTEVLKLRYELAALHEREQTLDAQTRDLTVQMRQLRDPRRLSARASTLGFRRPDRLIDLPAAVPATPRLAKASPLPRMEPTQ
jgi:hypothetical protein